MNFGEKSTEKKHEFPMTIPVTPVKIPAAAGRAHEESSKTVGPAGDSLDKTRSSSSPLHFLWWGNWRANTILHSWHRHP
jgi:hypothetical protein